MLSFDFKVWADGFLFLSIGFAWSTSSKGMGKYSNFAKYFKFATFYSNNSFYHYLFKNKLNVLKNGLPADKKLL